LVDGQKVQHPMFWYYATRLRELFSLEPRHDHYIKTLCESTQRARDRGPSLQSVSHVERHSAWSRRRCVCNDKVARHSSVGICSITCSAPRVSANSDYSSQFLTIRLVCKWQGSICTDTIDTSLRHHYVAQNYDQLMMSLPRVQCDMSA
jgi:hypothetical protein